MKRWVLSVLGMVAAVGAFGQKLELEEKTFDFGTIDNLKTVSHKLFFRNAGDKPLTVSVKASCGCTIGKLAKELLMPDERSYVEVEFNPRGRSGKNRKSITFTTNEPGRNTSTVMFTANIEPLWVVNPRRIEMEWDLESGSLTPGEQEFTLTNAAPKPLYLDGLTCHHKDIAVSGPEGPRELAPGEKVTFRAGLRDGVVPSRNISAGALWRLRYDGESTTEAMNVMVTIKPLWKTPRRVEFAYHEDKGRYLPETQPLTVENVSEVELTLKSVSSRNQKLLVKGGDACLLKPGEAKQIELSVDPEFRSTRPLWAHVEMVFERNGRTATHLVSVYLRAVPRTPSARPVVRPPVPRQVKRRPNVAVPGRPGTVAPPPPPLPPAGPGR